MIDKTTINKKPNSVPSGIWETKYGSMKIYSDIKSNAKSIDEKIPIEKITYLKFEKTSFKEFIISENPLLV
jgi:hypothetical protein